MSVTPLDRAYSMRQLVRPNEALRQAGQTGDIVAVFGEAAVFSFDWKGTTVRGVRQEALQASLDGRQTLPVELLEDGVAHAHRPVERP